MRLLRLVVVAAADSAALVTLYPDWTQLAAGLGAPHRWLARAGSDQAALTLVSALLWCAALWLALGLGFAAGAALPGRTGALARGMAMRLLPAIVLRAVAGIAGLSVLIAPVAASAKTPQGAGPAGKTPQGAALLSRAVATPSWPMDPQHSRVRIGWPTDTPAAPLPSPRPQPPHASPVAPNAGGSVRVQPGDSLWLIAARRFSHPASDAEIAAAWPRWYAANAQVIGADPSVIRPGEVLRAPDAGRLDP